MSGNKDGILYKNSLYTIHVPEKSEWTMHCASVSYTPDKGKEPSWFHRKMQEWILGFKWRKNK